MATILKTNLFTTRSASTKSLEENSIQEIVDTINDESSLTLDITGNAATATTLETSRTISLSGDVSGSVSFNGSQNVDITAVVADDSHNHIISNVDGLQTALDNKLNLSGGTLTGDLTLETDLILENTTNANQDGIIYKNSTPFIHNFNYGNNGTVVTTGENVFVGESAGNLTMGSEATESYHASSNTAVGKSTLANLTTGYYNTAVGRNAGSSLTTGFFNTAIGTSSLYLNQTNNYNTALGVSSLRNTSADGATGIGYESFYNATTNTNSIAIGYQSAKTYNNEAGNLTSAVNSIYIGALSEAGANAVTNEIVIGYDAVGHGSNTATIGNDSITKTILNGNVGIGTTSPNDYREYSKTSW